MKIILSFSLLLLIVGLSATDYDWIWANRMGSVNGNDKAYRVETDALGNVYVTGDYTSIASFGAFTLQPFGTNNTESDIFLAKYNPQGQCLWVTRAGSAWWDRSFALTIDPSGNVYISGMVTGYGPTIPLIYAYFGNSAFNLPYGYNIYVAKYDPNGTFLNLATAGPGSLANSPITVQAMDADSQGNVYVTGYYYNSVSFGALTLTSQNSSYSCFIAKLGSSGSWQWVQKVDLPGDDSGTAIAVDATGVYVSGGSYGGGTMNGDNIPANGLYDVFVGKISLAGAWLWTKFYGSAGSDLGLGICTDGDGTVYLSGYIGGTCNIGGVSISPYSGSTQNAFIASLDTSGATLWAKALTCATTSSAGALARDGSNFVVTGMHGSTLSFPPLAPVTGSGVYLARFDSSGTALNLDSVSITTPLPPSSVYANSSGGIYLTGAFSGTVNFGTQSITSSGNNDGYLAFRSPRQEIILDIITLSPGELTLNWQYVAGASGYRIYAADNPEGEWDLLAEVGTSSNTYALGNPVQNRRFYKITAITL